MSGFKKIVKGEPLPAGADLHDFVMSGWSAEEIIDWGKERAVVVVRDFKLVVAIQNNITVNTAEDNGVVSETTYSLWERLGLVLSQQGQPICNEDNVARIFEGEDTLQGTLWFDDFYNSVFIGSGDNAREIKDLEIFKLTMHLQRAYGMRRISDATVRRALVCLADRIHKNEPKDWMESLVWDEQPRIDQAFISYFGATASPYVIAASKNFWISMVARTYDPGCIMRSMVILKSKQMAGKSTAFSIIGGKWYSEALENIQSKDFLQSLHGNLLIEFGDLSGMDRADVNRIKQIISCRKDRFRAPYDRQPSDHYRRCVLVGSTNEGHFLRDDTGGTRFWPIETKSINQEALSRDREQLFAEAVVRYKQRDNWHIMPAEETEAVQESYRQSDEWEQIIDNYLSNLNGMLNHEITVQKIAMECLKIPNDRLDKSTQMRIARNLSVIGLERKTVRKGDKIIKIWAQKSVTTNEVETFD